MLGIDDLVLAPFRGLVAVARQITAAIEDERAGEADRIGVELRDLYRALEEGALGEAEFDERERILLDRLDVAAREGHP